MIYAILAMLFFASPALAAPAIDTCAVDLSADDCQNGGTNAAGDVGASGLLVFLDWDSLDTGTQSIEVSLVGPASVVDLADWSMSPHDVNAWDYAFATGSVYFFGAGDVWEARDFCISNGGFDLGEQAEAEIVFGFGADSSAVSPTTSGLYLDHTRYFSSYNCSGTATTIDTTNYPVSFTFDDTDFDDVIDGEDNCTGYANAGQDDADGDGYGNACDGDFNQDGATGGPDYNTFRACLGQSVPGTGPAADPLCLESNMAVDGAGAVGSPDFNLFNAEYGTAPGPSCCGDSLP